jgi:hypothetical protein
MKIYELAQVRLKISFKVLIHHDEDTVIGCVQVVRSRIAPGTAAWTFCFATFDESKERDCFLA